MKRNWVMVAVLLLVGLALVTSQALAAPAVKKPIPRGDASRPAAGPVIDIPDDPPNPGGGGKGSGQGQGQNNGQGNGQDNDKQNKGSGNQDKEKDKNKDQGQSQGQGQEKDKGQGQRGNANPPGKENCKSAQASAEACPPEDSQAKAHKQHFRGELTGITSTTITVTLPNGEQITFDISNIRIHIPTLGKNATWEDLYQHAQVTVEAVKPAEGANLMATSLHVVPGKPSVSHQAGTVDAYDPDQKTITVAGQTFLIDEHTQIVPAGATVTQDAQVTVIVRRDVTGGPLVAHAIVVKPGKSEKK